MSGLSEFAQIALPVAVHDTYTYRIPEELRGRIMALWGIAFLGSRPIAAFVDGTIADLASPRAAAWTAAAIVTLCALVVRWRVR